jgi:uncharacterized membrane protein
MASNRRNGAPPGRSSNHGWLLAAAAALVLVGGALLPPLMDGAGRFLAQQAFAPVCHQMSERSFAVGGVPLAVCHRCFGIYTGLLLGALAWPFVGAGEKAGAGRRAGVLVVAAGAPTSLDWALGVAGWWANTPLTRAGTGTLLGVALGLLLARAATQAVAGSRRRRLA